MKSSVVNLSLVSIPRWFDWETTSQRDAASPEKVSIPRWFDWEIFQKAIAMLL
ncbi:MAG: hypothetical protein M0R39_13285 [Prolixibacteraceae bacterium]|nr:hypothetical protein [Prolixibacteraceae bacterium]